MKNSYLVALAVTGALAMVPSARADQFAFSFSGGGVNSSGTFTASPTSTPGAYEITAISGTFADANDGISGAITGLYTPVSYTVPPAFTAAGFSYDDTFWPGGDSPHNCADYPFYGGDFDVYGVTFNVSGGYVGAIWSDGIIPGRGLVYGTGDSSAAIILNNPNQGMGVPVTFAASAVPEPGSLKLLGLALLAAAGAYVRKIRSRCLV